MRQWLRVERSAPTLRGPIPYDHAELELCAPWSLTDAGWIGSTRCCKVGGTRILFLRHRFVTTLSDIRHTLASTSKCANQLTTNNTMTTRRIVSSILIGTLALAIFNGTAQAQSDDALINKLIQKGILTEKEAQDIKKESTSTNLGSASKWKINDAI